MTIAYLLGLGIILDFKSIGEVIDTPIGLFALFVVLRSMDYLVLYPFINTVDEWEICSHHDFFEESQGEQPSKGRSFDFEEGLLKCLIN